MIGKAKKLLQRHCGWTNKEVDALFQQNRNLSLSDLAPKIQRFYHVYQQHTLLSLSSWNPFATKEDVAVLAQPIHQMMCSMWPEQTLLWHTLAPSLTPPMVRADSSTIDHTLWTFFWGDSYLEKVHHMLPICYAQRWYLSMMYEHSDLTKLSFEQQTQYFDYLFKIKNAFCVNASYARSDSDVLVQWMQAWCHHHQRYLPRPYGREALRLLWTHDYPIDDLSPLFDPNIHYFVTQTWHIENTIEYWKVIFSDLSQLLMAVEMGTIHSSVSIGTLKQKYATLFRRMVQHYVDSATTYPIDEFLQPDDYRLLMKEPSTMGAVSPRCLTQRLALLKEEEQFTFMEQFAPLYPLFTQWRTHFPFEQDYQSIASLERDLSRSPSTLEMNIHF